MESRKTRLELKDKIFKLSLIPIGSLRSHCLFPQQGLLLLPSSANSPCHHCGLPYLLLSLSWNPYLLLPFSPAWPSFDHPPAWGMASERSMVPLCLG